MKLQNSIYIGANNRKSLIDFELPADQETKTILVFIHGYKGYKNWGCWDLVQRYFVLNGYGFCKFNLSHNGGTVDNPIDFPDLDAFAENRYTYELIDIQKVLDWLETKVTISNYNVYLVGHSRGGGDAILSGADNRITGVITWSSIADVAMRFPTGDELNEWKQKGVRYVKNARTNQDMPHNYTMYEDWLNNQSTLDISSKAKQLKRLNKRCFHIHGDSDEAVSITESEKLSNWTRGKLIIIRSGNHTFNSKQPWKNEKLPSKLKEVCTLTKQFISNV